MSNLYPFLVYVVVTTFTPGPNNIVSMTNGIHNSYPKMLKFLAGLFSGFFIVMLDSGLLNVALVSLLPSLEQWLKILGVIYMLYLAFHIARSKPVAEGQPQDGLNTFKFGFGMQFLNIKVILYGISVFSLFIINSYRDLPMIALFSLALAGVGFLSTSTWAVGGNLFHKLLRKNQRPFNLLMAALLVYTAVASLL